MPSSRPKSLYWQGFRDALPFTLIVAPFAIVFGVVATEAGLSLAQTFSFSILVVAGASQFAALQLMIENAPILVIVATGLAVNLRMAMYSASLAPHLGAAPLWQRALIAYLCVDQSYAMSHAKYEATPDLVLHDKVRYFFGVASPVIPIWYLMTLVGAVLGQSIPPAWSLDFAVPIAFLAIVAPMLRTVAHVAAALTSVLLALALFWMPLNLGLLLAGLAAMCVGVAIEIWMERRPV